MKQRVKKNLKILGLVLGVFAFSTIPITLGVIYSPTIYKIPNKSSYFTDDSSIPLSDYYDLYKQSLKYPDKAYALEVLCKRFSVLYQQHWYETLSSGKWNVDKNGKLINAYCNSEQQALMLYVNYWGDYWNYPLHQGKEPVSKVVSLNNKFFKNQHLEIRGSDYKFIESALAKGKAPMNFVVYHGVEFMETEFYDQLKDYIIQNPDGSYNYQNVIGKTIQTQGFLSCTFNYSIAKRFSSGSDWMFGGGGLKPPLKESTVFKIYIEKGTPNVAYVSDVLLNNEYDDEAQTMININSRFKILNITKDENGVNTWEIKMLK